jgi:hypothetical protein
MKKNLLIFLFITFNLLLQAQQLLVSSTYAVQQGRNNEEIVPSVVVKNNSNRSMDLRWERVKNNLPYGWESVVCDKQCYSTLVESRTFTLSAGESLSDFRVGFRPNGIDGAGNTEIRIYEVKNPSNSVTVSFTGNAQQSNNSNNSVSNNILTIYPNPATEHIMLQDSNGEVKFLEVYNVMGRKVLDFTIVNSSAKYDVSELSRGMYMVRMLDKYKNIIRTQRISKYNP